MKYLILLFAFILSSCISMESAKISPEDLLNSSSEQVSISLDSDNAVDQLRSWIDDDKPSRAILSCNANDNKCHQVKNLLRSNLVRYDIGSDNTNVLVLSYDRAAVLGCSGAGSIGCSVSTNSLQMINDFQQIINPDLSDPQDAAKAVDRYNKLYQ